MTVLVYGCLLLCLTVIIDDMYRCILLYVIMYDTFLIMAGFNIHLLLRETLIVGNFQRGLCFT